MPDNYDNLSREQLISLLRKRDLARRLGLVWERDEIEHERLLTDEIPLVELDSGLSRGAGPWNDLLIEGDNFPALRFLRAAFKGRVKCIYIDPPYNTGNRDFVYNDRYLDADNAFRHSTWLEFLYRRLSLARDLLREDGVLLVSINDENRAYLELLLSQIWPGGRIGSLVWRTRDSTSAKDHNFSDVHEHVLVWAGESFNFNGADKTQKKYKNPDGDTRGLWNIDPLTLGYNRFERENLYYPINNPKTGRWYPCDPDLVWRYATEKTNTSIIRTETMEEWIRQDKIVFPIADEERVVIWNSREELMASIKTGDVPVSSKKKIPLLREDTPDLDFWIGKPVGFGRPGFKKHWKDLRSYTNPLSSWISRQSEEWEEEDCVVIKTGGAGEGTNVLQELLKEKVFNYPKPPSLLRGLVDQSTGPGDIVLDFFAGSATTAQAVAELNERDAQVAREAGESVPERRRWIMVSSTEATEDEPDKNICRDVAARRLAALNLEYAYLRMRSAPALFDGRGLEESWLEPSLQLLLAALVGKPAKGGKLAWLEGEDSVVVYVRELSKALLDELEAYEPSAGKTAIIASFQPGPLKQRLGQKPDMRVLALPDFLVKNLASTGHKP